MKAKPKAKPRRVREFRRSSVTGRFVSVAYARRHPRTTELWRMKTTAKTVRGA